MKTVTEHQRTKPMCYKERKNYNYKKVFHTNFFFLKSAEVVGEVVEEETEVG